MHRLGACVSLCPYQVIYHDRTVQLHQCDLEDGKCYAFCPRTETDLAALRKLLFKQGDLTPEIGAVKGYYFSQSVDPRLREVAQHGATVTALMELALTEGLIDSAIVSSRDRQFLQNSAVVKDIVEIRNNAKSKFTVSPTAAAFNQLLMQDSGNVGVVATPCQALALAKMKLYRTSNKTQINQPKLVIGLYCGWTLSMEKYIKLLLENNIALESVTGMDIPAGGNVLELYTDDGAKSIPFDAVQSCIREACRYCMDSTAEGRCFGWLARFSGNWSDVRKWNQLIVRTEKGRELVELAVKKGVLEVREAPAENLKELKNAAVNKKKAR